MGPTSERLKRLAAALRLTPELQSLKASIRPAAEGAFIQSTVIVGSIPVRTLRHWAYGRMGMRLGRGVVIHRRLQLRAPEGIEVGEGSVVGFGGALDGRCGITIGRHVNLSSDVAIWTLEHDPRDSSFAVVGGPVTIGDRAWISFRATILPRVSVGEGAVVAAGAVVTQDVPPYAIVAGVPARVIGERPRDLCYDLKVETSPWFV